MHVRVSEYLEHSINVKTYLGLVVPFILWRCLQTLNDNMGVRVGRRQALGSNHRVKLLSLYSAFAIIRHVIGDLSHR